MAKIWKTNVLKIEIVAEIVPFPSPVKKLEINIENPQKAKENENANIAFWVSAIKSSSPLEKSNAIGLARVMPRITIIKDEIPITIKTFFKIFLSSDVFFAP